MQDFKNILYVSRGNKDEAYALQQTLGLAFANKAKLTILSLTPHLPDNMSEYEDNYERTTKEHLEVALANACKAINIPDDAMRQNIEFEHNDIPSTLIIQKVLQNDHDLLIKMPDSEAGRLGLQSVDMDLLRKCPCPVWLCREISRPQKSVKVGVAIDPKNKEEAAKTLSKTLLSLSSALSKECNGKLEIISCWDFEHEHFLRHNTWGKVSDEKVDNEVKQAEETHKKALMDIIQDAKIDEDSYVLSHIRGDAQQNIPKYVRDNSIDILVMGTLARTGIPGLIMGNTAENIVQALSCSVMTLKPNGFVTPVKAYK